MRKIKFRAIVQGENNFTYSNGFMKHKDGTVIIITKELDEHVETSPIIENTLCQFTGLTDKNGVEIFEGDIVKSVFKYKDEPSKEILAIVKYDTLNPCFVLEYKYQGNGFLCQEYDFIQCGLRTNEVIGNIYENPELLC
jgi:uncharacterized phage protein (TIGR01671 family)